MTLIFLAGGRARGGGGGGGEKAGVGGRVPNLFIMLPGCSTQKIELAAFFIIASAPPFVFLYFCRRVS
jgi:hypothetical protein